MQTTSFLIFLWGIEMKTPFIYSFMTFMLSFYCKFMGNLLLSADLLSNNWAKTLPLIVVMDIVNITFNVNNLNVTSMLFIAVCFDMILHYVSSCKPDLKDQLTFIAKPHSLFFSLALVMCSHADGFDFISHSSKKSASPLCTPINSCVVTLNV